MAERFGIKDVSLSGAKAVGAEGAALMTEAFLIGILQDPSLEPTAKRRRVDKELNRLASLGALLWQRHPHPQTCDVAGYCLSSESQSPVSPTKTSSGAAISSGFCLQRGGAFATNKLRGQHQQRRECSGEDLAIGNN